MSEKTNGFAIYKEPSADDPFARYAYDCAWRDFWCSKNTKGKIVLLPILIVILIVLIPFLLLGNIDKDAK